MRTDAALSLAITLFSVLGCQNLLGIEDREVGHRACTVDDPFDDPVPLSDLNSMNIDAGLRLSGNGLVAYFSSDRRAPDQSVDIFSTQWLFGSDIYVARRNSITADFAAPEPLNPFAEPKPIGEVHASETADGLDIYVGRVTDTEQTITHASRGDASASYGQPEEVDNLPDGVASVEPYVLPDGSALYFAANVASIYDFDLYRAPIVDGKVQTPVPLSSVNATGDNTTSFDSSPVVTRDELVLYFTSSRLDGKGLLDIWVATRAAASEDFGTARPVTQLNTSDIDEVAYVSDDNCTLYLYGRRGGTSADMFRAVRHQ
jgi:hypothetical protein